MVRGIEIWRRLQRNALNYCRQFGFINQCSWSKTNCLSTRRWTVFYVILEVRETGNNPLSLKLKGGAICSEWLICVHRTKQSAKQIKILWVFLTNVFWLSLVTDTKSTLELKPHEIVHPKKLPISHRRGTENNQTERYGKEVSHVSSSSEVKNEGLSGLVWYHSQHPAFHFAVHLWALLWKSLGWSAQGGCRKIIGVWSLLEASLNPQINKLADNSMARCPSTKDRQRYRSLK